MRIASGFVVGIAIWTVITAPVQAQAVFAPHLTSAQPQLSSLDGQANEAVPGELAGVVRDADGEPLAGAVVSAVGATPVFAVSDAQGRFVLRGLPPGSYVVRAHLQGYQQPRGRIVRIQAAGRQTSTLSLARLTGDPRDRERDVIAASISGGARTRGDDGGQAADPHDHDELAWRLRHSPRSVLKEAEHVVAAFAGGDLETSNARFANPLFADLPISGQFNLLTTTSFDRPQDLFSLSAGRPSSVAYLALEGPGAHGDWAMQGTITQGDVASWMLAGTYARRRSATHAYEAGVSYSMQRYLAGNGVALATIPEGSRSVGAVYGYDSWAVTRNVQLSYGAKYASYDYLDDRGLLSPRVSISIQPRVADSLRLHATVAHTEFAPGAEEFLPPTVGLWLPPERTFSQVSQAAFRPERRDYVEVAMDREWSHLVFGVRAFRERVDDQVATVFGLDPGIEMEHYQVGSAGSYTARGWGVSVRRPVNDHVMASVDYTQSNADWHSLSTDAAALAAVAASVLRSDERIHDLTAAIESLVSPTETRIIVLYKVNSAFARDEASRLDPGPGVRFDVQVNQALPFLDFTTADWEMLVAVSNLFKDELLDASTYDELFVVRPPKRVLGGVTVRF